MIMATAVARPVVVGSWVEKDCAESALPIFQQAFADFLDSATNSFGRALHLHNALRRLREHFLGSNHPCTRSILDSFYLESITTDDGTHQVVGDQEADGGMKGSRRGGRYG